MLDATIEHICLLIKNATATELRALEHIIFEKRFALEKAEKEKFENILKNSEKPVDE
jgi:hypothetical protein